MGIFAILGLFQSSCDGKSDKKYLWKQKSFHRYFLGEVKPEKVGQKYLWKQKSSHRYFLGEVKPEKVSEKYLWKQKSSLRYFF